MRIIIDLDNTVIDSYQAIATLYKEKTGESVIPFTPQTVGEISKQCPLFTESQTSDCFRDTRFFELVQPFESAVEVLKRLSEEGHEIIVASLHKHLHKAKRQWVLEALPFLNYPALKYGDSWVIPLPPER